MTRPTHEQYSVCFAFITMMLFYKYGITQLNYYIALVILLEAAKAGALFPDVDHTWQNIAEKTIPNKIINVLIHITGGTHRSWQTHSWDICIIFTAVAYLLPKYLYYVDKISIVNSEVLGILMLGFASGWISHLLSDMLTSAGVKLICFINFKVKFVPRRLFGITFNTGHEWEAFNFKVMKILNIFLGIGCLIYPLIINGYINKFIGLF